MGESTAGSAASVVSGMMSPFKLWKLNIVNLVKSNQLSKKCRNQSFMVPFTVMLRLS